MTSFQWRYRFYVTEKRHQTNVIRFFNFELLPIKISGYGSGYKPVLLLNIFGGEEIRQT